MQLQIVDETHNHVGWIGRTPLLKLLLGVLAGWGVLAAFVLTAPGPQAIRVGLTASGVALVLALLLALTTPLAELGRLERTLDGGNISRRRRWLLRGRHVTWEAPLESIAGFQMEVQAFEETTAYTYILARLWVALDDGSFAQLTDWADTDATRALGAALAKAGRRVFEE